MEECIEGVKLNLGCGKVYWNGWINIDFEAGDIYCDLRQLDLRTNYADVVAAIHVVEHFYAWEAVDLLKEWRRVLKPGGKLILELPCMDKVLAHIHQCMSTNLPMSAGFTWSVFWGDPKYQDPYMVHRWGYTMEMIQQTLIAAGFDNIEFKEPLYHFPMRDMRIEAIKPC